VFGGGGLHAVVVNTSFGNGCGGNFYCLKYCKCWSGGSTVLLLFATERSSEIDKYCSDDDVTFVCISNNILLLLDLL
jgi:hypothetical protein